MLEEFFEKYDIKKLIEQSNTSGGGVDDGPVYWSPSFASYAARGYADAGRVGYNVVDYMLPKRFNQKFDIYCKSKPGGFVTKKILTCTKNIQMDLFPQ